MQWFTLEELTGVQDDPSKRQSAALCLAKNIPEGLMCNPECQKYRLVERRAETMVNCDMGLYLDFQVEDEWRTVGCQGLERFNYTMWSKRFTIPSDNLQIEHFDDKSLCFLAAENPKEEESVQVLLGKCGDNPTALNQWKYDEETGKINLADE